MDDEDLVMVTKSPVKRLGSTRKLLFFNNIRLQLTEQLRCLEGRMEAQIALVSELQDYFRRRAEVELDYSKSLDKLAKSLHLRHKEQKQKREQWPLFSSYSCWQQLVTQTKKLSKDHAALSEVYSNQLVSRLGQVTEDVQRMYRKCREIGYETHEEILRVLHELHTTMKTYHAYQGEFKQAENKLRLAENQRLKLEASLPKDKLDRSKKYRLIEKEVQKRKTKYNDAKLKALKAKNEYVLCLEASNTTIHKYFVDDLSDLIDCMDFGFHNCISRALLMHISAEEGLERSVQAGLDNLQNCIGGLDSRLDKQRFLESNHAAFMIPKKFEFQGLRGDELSESQAGLLSSLGEPELEKALRNELELRLVQLQSRVTSLRAESEEVWKTLETAELTLLEMLDTKDYDCSDLFNEPIPGHITSSVASGQQSSKPPETVQIKLRADRQETEEFYMTKFREYLLGTSRIARLDAKQEHLRRTLREAEGCLVNDNTISTWRTSENTTNGSSMHALSLSPQSHAKPPRRKRIGRQMNQQPKLFGGSLEEYLEITNQEIPLVLKSCIRVINLYGLHHQGIFRVSGSQVEINNFRDSFERGDDPLAEVTDASDINSVAGVLKLYLRELREPLFPTIYFEQFMQLPQLDSKQAFVSKARELILSLPRPVLIVMRYLFAFLNHLSEYADENMMDPYNLAICFGPTLVPVPEDKDQVQYQNLVNELIKNIILFNDEIFPVDIGSTVYEKYISKEPDECDVGDSPSEQIQEDLDSEVYPSEDESDVLEATAQFDFTARSDRELSLKKGDIITLYTQVSNDWWRGSANGKDGLVPDKYIMLKIKDEDREKMDLLKSSSSEESMKRRVSSSNDSILSSATSSSAQNSPLIWPQPEDPNKTQLTHIHNESTISQPLQEGNYSIHLETDNNQEERLNVFHLKRGEEDSSEDETEESETIIHRRTHHKSQSVGNPIVNTEFTVNRELWQRRATSQIEPSGRHTPDLVVDLPVKAVEDDNSSLGPESPDMSTTAERFAKPNQCTLKKNTKTGKNSVEVIVCSENILQSEKISQVKTELELVLNPTAHQQRLKPKLIFETPPVAPTSQNQCKPQVKIKPQLMRKPVLPISVTPLQATPELNRHKD